MSACDCCGCVTRDNYRAHRVVARKFDVPSQGFIYEVSFAKRTSDTQSFDAFYDRVGNAQGWEPSRDGDTGPPYRLENTRVWGAVNSSGQTLTQVDGQWTASGHAMNGFSTLVGVVGNEFYLDGYWNATQSTTAAAIVISAGGHTAAVRLEERDGGPEQNKFPVFGAEIGGVFPPVGGVVPSSQDVETLEFGGTSIRTSGFGAPGVGLVFRYNSGHYGSNDDGGYVTAIARPVPLAGGGSGEINASSASDPNDPNIWPDPAVYTPTPYPKSVAGYYPGPVAFRGRLVTVFRNGALVATLTNPTAGQAMGVSSVPGSYLIVNEVRRLADPPWTGPGIDDRRRTSRPLKSFVSFAVDNVPPVLGASAPLDFYAGFPRASEPDPFGTGTAWFSQGWANATKPVIYNRDLPENFRFFAPSLYDNDLAPPPYLSGNAHVLDSDPAVTPTAAGTYTVRHAAHRVTPNCLFGIDAASVPTFPLTIHAVPASGVRAPMPRLREPGYETAEYFRPRLQTERVQSVELAFVGGRVQADGVKAEHLTLTRDGETVGGVTLSRVSDQRWRITIPANPQTPKAFFVLTYQPAELKSAFNRVERWPTFDRFPPAASAEWRVAYVDEETGKWYTRTLGGYLEIPAGSPPRDASGNDYVEESVVCAARVSWLMAADQPWPRPKNTEQTGFAEIGSVPSIGRAVGEFDDQTGRFSFETTGNAHIDDWGRVRSAGKVDGFDPNCPADSPDSPVASYFGLKTTIDPCPPKTLACPAPLAIQRHSSMFRTTSLIGGFSVGMTERRPATFRPPVWSPRTVSSQIYGDTLRQGVWAGPIEPGQVPGPPYPFQLGALAGPTTTLQIVGGIMRLYASRDAYEYGHMETATLSELALSVWQTLLIRRQPAQGAPTLFFYHYRDLITVSREDEDALANGGSIQYPAPITSDIAPFRRCFWWDIRAQ